MKPARLEFEPYDPELRIRRYDPNQDEDCVKTGGEAPSYVLELIPLDDEPLAWAFHRTPGQVSHFHEESIRGLGKEEFKRNKFDALTEGSRRAKLRAVLQASHEFFANALDPEDLGSLISALGAIGSGSPLRVSNDVDSNALGLPWPLLQLTPPPGSNVVSAKETLGFRFALAGTLASFGSVAELRRLPFGDALGALLEAHDGETAFGFVDDPSLKSVRLGSERKAIKDRMGSAFDPLHDCPDVPDLSGEEAPEPPGNAAAGSLEGLSSIEQLVDYLTGATRVATHFCCHGRFGTAGASSLRYVFIVRNDHPVDAVALQKSLFKKAGSTLSRAGRVSSRFLFLNMCRSEGAHQQTVSASNALHLLGPEALVSTMGDVCDEAAAALAVVFYGHALDDGLDVGQALHLSLRSSLSSSFNPAYLLFMFRGDSRVRIA